MRGELEECERQSLKVAANEKRVREDLEQMKAECVDVQRAKRALAIEHEQVKRAYDKFRSLIIQSIYAIPGLSSPPGDNETLSDQDLLAKWQEIVDDRQKMYEKASKQKEASKALDDANKDYAKSVHALREFVNGSELRLENTARRSCNYESETKALEALGVAQRDCQRLKDALVHLLASHHRAQKDIESYIESILGIDINNNLCKINYINYCRIQFECYMLKVKLILISRMTVE